MPLATGHSRDRIAGAQAPVRHGTSAPLALCPGPLPHDRTHSETNERQRTAIRHEHRDFVVDEILQLDPQVAGQHCYLQVARCGLSTTELARQLAQLLSVEEPDIGYAGLKDKSAITRQWFSVPAPVPGAPGYDAFLERVQLLPQTDEHWRISLSGHDASPFAVTDMRWQPRKLRRGDHAGNHFSIRLLGARLDAGLTSALRRVSQSGAPNYFGHQRFGNDGNNVQRALDWLPRQRRSRRSFQRGLHLSVLRAQLFNAVLKERVRQSNWNVCLDGEDALDGMPTGPMWGRGRQSSRADAAELERACLLPWWPVALALEHAGLKQQRRPLIAIPEGLYWEEESDVPDGKPSVRVSFSLPPGCFATSVLRELVSFAGDLADG